MAVGAICSLAQLSCFGVCTQRFSSFPGAPVNRSQWRGRMKTRKHPKGSYVLLLMFYKESCGCQMNLGPTPAVAAFFSGNPERERKVLANISFVHFGNCFWFLHQRSSPEESTKSGRATKPNIKMSSLPQKKPNIVFFFGVPLLAVENITSSSFQNGTRHFRLLLYCCFFSRLSFLSGPKWV